MQIKTESTSNFNFQCIKTLYQNSLNDFAFFFHFSRTIDLISYLQNHQRQFLMGGREN